MRLAARLAPARQCARRPLSTHPVPPGLRETANVTPEIYKEMYAQSVSDNDGFWGSQARERLTWIKDFDTVKDIRMDDSVSVEWFKGGQLNVSQNCVDRHLETRADQTAIIWESDCGSKEEHISYAELHARVCKFANTLKGMGVEIDNLDLADPAALEKVCGVSVTIAFCVCHYRTSLSCVLFARDARRRSDGPAAAVVSVLAHIHARVEG